MKYTQLKRKHGGFRGYLQHLHDVFRTWATPEEVAGWTRDRFVGLCRRVAEDVRVPPDWLWAVLVTESGYPPRPVGIAGTGWADDPVEWAYRHNTSAYGVTQITGTTFDGLQHEVTARYHQLKSLMDLPHLVIVNHDDLYHPFVGLLAGAVLLRRLIARHGQDPEAVFTAYTGRQKTARLKLEALKKYGGEVTDHAG